MTKTLHQRMALLAFTIPILMLLVGVLVPVLSAMTMAALAMVWFGLTAFAWAAISLLIRVDAAADAGSERAKKIAYFTSSGSTTGILVMLSMTALVFLSLVGLTKAIFGPYIGG